jgi:hypothetical protein
MWSVILGGIDGARFRHRQAGFSSAHPLITPRKETWGAHDWWPYLRRLCLRHRRKQDVWAWKPLGLSLAFSPPGHSEDM